MAGRNLRCARVFSRVAQSIERSASNAEDKGENPFASTNLRNAGRYKLAAPVLKTGSAFSRGRAAPTLSAILKFVSELKQSARPITEHAAGTTSLRSVSFDSANAQIGKPREASEYWRIPKPFGIREVLSCARKRLGVRAVLCRFVQVTTRRVKESRISPPILRIRQFFLTTNQRSSQ
jgi:hypothetical protein